MKTNALNTSVKCSVGCVLAPIGIPTELNSMAVSMPSNRGPRKKEQCELARYCVVTRKEIQLIFFSLTLILFY